MVADHQGGRDRRAGAVSGGDGVVGMKMDGKTVLITGSTDGVGRYVAARLAASRRQGPDPWPRPARGPRALIEEIKRAGDSEPDLLSGRSVLACRGAEARRSRAGRPHAAGCFRQQCRDRIAERGAGAANQPGRPRAALRRQLSLRLSARASAAAVAEGKRAVAHRQCRFARPAPDRFRRRHDHQGLQRQPRLCAEQAVADHVHDRSRRSSSREAALPSIRCIRRPT